MKNMRIETKVAEAYANSKAEVEALPGRIARGEGLLLHDGRNRVWLFSCGGEQVVVKQFHRLGFFKSLVYTFFRKSKARRSFDNGLRLRQLHVLTPEPIAMMQVRRLGLIRDTYYVTALTDWPAIRRPLTEQQPYNRPLAEAFASFVASLHQKGIIHRDLNNTNVLYHSVENDHHAASGNPEERGFEFMLIDINRMSFSTDGQAPSDRRCLENLTLFAPQGPMFNDFARAYVRARGWAAARVADVLEAKQRHDSHWQTKKKWKKLWKTRFRS